jgi:hypothetical protein
MSEGLGRSVGMPNMGQIEEEQDEDQMSSHAGSQSQDHELGTLKTDPEDPNYAEVAVSRHSINEGDDHDNPTLANHQSHHIK